MKERKKIMNNVETMTLKQAMEDISRMIEHKDCTIHEQQATIEFLKDDAKHVYNHGVDDGFAKGVNAGMEKAWSLANRIIHLDWIGNETIHTVEDWFELFTAKDAMEVMNDMDKKGEKPHWKEDIVRNVYECSKCGFASMIRYKFCPDCGVKME
jgi:rubrerythrin